MQRILEGASLPPLPNGAVVTIGTFDGVHRGHQQVLAELRRLADELACPAVVVTFDRHPASVVRPETAPRLLTAPAQRFELLDAAGVDYAHVLRFDEERSLESPEEFVREIVVGTWHARLAVEGEDFHFGHRRRGHLTTLEETGARWGFKVASVPTLIDEVSGVAVSSEAIRHALHNADHARIVTKTSSADKRS